MYKDKNFYLNLFQVSEAQLERLAAEGLKGGGSYCDLFFENTSYNDLLLRDGIGEKGAVDAETAITYLLYRWTRFCGVPFTDQGISAESARHRW